MKVNGRKGTYLNPRNPIISPECQPFCHRFFSAYVAKATSAWIFKERFDILDDYSSAIFTLQERDELRKGLTSITGIRLGEEIPTIISSLRYHDPRSRRFVRLRGVPQCLSKSLARDAEASMLKKRNTIREKREQDVPIKERLSGIFHLHRPNQ